uniref:C2H2-type domain-containing protein n=1 Tax=Globodera rostochiensis TaxID=31243 RepID=A0A914I3Q2_GLORO
MEPFHANLLLLQCQRFSMPPQPFDCAIRLKGPEQKEFLLFGHSHILAAKCLRFRSQLDQSVPISTQNVLFGSNKQQQFSGDLIGFAQTAVQKEVHELKLDLSMLDNALDCFKTFLTFLYGDLSSTSGADPDSLVFLSKLLETPDLEVSSLLGKFLLSASSLPAAFPLPSPVSSTASGSSSSSGSVNFQPMPNNENTLPLYLAYLQLQSLLQQQQQQQFQQQHPHIQSLSLCPTSSAAAPMPMSVLLAEMFSRGALPVDGKTSAITDRSVSSTTVAPSESAAASSLSSSVSTEQQDTGDLCGSVPSSGGANILVPSNDKEGWCRNKKYIQIVKKGYRCLVCNKVYGRYNSVSYHVTIYHRNPPIRCEEEGCQFTTREARYIHFHKYYRHQIALPESIDLASRKCPLIGCKHVSKSPAMLDKHIHRHVADCLKDAVYVCAMPAKGGESDVEVQADDEQEQCQFKANGHEAMYEHLLSVHSTGPRVVKMDEYQQIEKTVPTATRNHQQQTPPISASAPATPPTPSSARAFPCDQCNFKGRTMVALEQHKVQKHQRARTGTLPSVTPMAGMTAPTETVVHQQNGGSPLNGLSLLSGVFSSVGGASLPDSPLSPAGTVSGGGLFPSALPAPPLLLSASPFLPSVVVDQQHLLAQLIAAQQKLLASSLLGSPPPPPQHSEQSPVTTGVVDDSNGTPKFLYSHKQWLLPMFHPCRKVPILCLCALPLNAIE